MAAEIERLKNEFADEVENSAQHVHCERCQDEIERLKENEAKIQQWCDAYPLDIFPEPDLKKANEVLTENGMTLDAISASAMRKVLRGIKEIIKAQKSEEE